MIVNIGVSFILDNGKRVKFWKDKQCGNESSLSFFSSLYALVNLKEWMIDLWNQSNLSGWWTHSLS